MHAVVLFVGVLVMMPFTFFDEFSEGLWPVFLAIDCMFIVDLFLNLFTGFLDKTDTIILTHGAIVRHYFKTWSASVRA